MKEGDEAKAAGGIARVSASSLDGVGDLCVEPFNVHYRCVECHTPPPLRPVET